ncbi:hypothetical protein EG329_004087 [Mollisiaceae sp. DMI_Dod_QoI]|nr:hypothetical protein EG329_004087 [Helotiales sp. DMI_Dod_QoI]
MGSTCSGIRRQGTQLEYGRHLAPPPYEPSRRMTGSFDLLDKEEPPSLSAHPALRDRRSPDRASTTTRSRVNANGSLSTTPNPQVPELAYLGSRSRLSSERNSHSTSPPPLEDENLAITASTTPLWRWTNAQCQIWIAAVLVQYAGRSPNEAKELASGFKGWGPNLYMKEWKQWNSWLGQDGQAIFALLMEVHSQEGAVPTSVEIAHYALEDRKRAVLEKERDRMGVPKERGMQRGRESRN